MPEGNAGWMAGLAGIIAALGLREVLPRIWSWWSRRLDRLDRQRPAAPQSPVDDLVQLVSMLDGRMETLEKQRRESEAAEEGRASALREHYRKAIAELQDELRAQGAARLEELRAYQTQHLECQVALARLERDQHHTDARLQDLIARTAALETQNGLLIQSLRPLLSPETP